jgi:hypothetical protein
MKIENKHVGRGKYVITFRKEDGASAFIDELTPSSARARSQFLDRVTEKLPSIDRDDLERQLVALADRPDDYTEPASDDALPDAEEDRTAAREVLNSADLMDTIGADLSALGLACDLEIGILTYLAFSSRLLAEPVCVFAQGPSSTGKTYIGTCAAGLMPPEDVFNVQGITPQALYYMGDQLKHSIILMGEWARDEDQTDDGLRTAAMRQLISDHRLSKLVTNTDTGRPTTEQATTEGPVAVYATSTLPMSRIFEEDANRFLFIHTDETENATRKVLARKAETAAGMEQAPTEQLERIKRRHHAMQRELRRQSADVIVPFAPALAKLFPSDQPCRRRDITKVFGLVKACALLHHCQRERDGEGRFVATLEDYRIVRGLLEPFMVKAGATPATLRKYDELSAALNKGEAFKRERAQEVWGLAKARAADLIKELREGGLLTDAGGADWTYRLRERTGERYTFLPSLEAVDSSCMECV